MRMEIGRIVIQVVPPQCAIDLEGQIRVKYMASRKV